MEGKCSRWKECEAVNQIGCSGCGFQHFEKILEANKNNQILESLGNKFFSLCSKQRKGTGGRVALDKPIKELLMEEISELKELSSNYLRVKLTIKQEEVDFKIKCEGAFQYNGKYIFYEVKGYGDNTNDVLSAITAAQLLKEIPKYKDSHYFYIGISSGKKDYKEGLKRGAFFDKSRVGVTPYVKWAESKGFLKFYGIIDIKDLLEEIKNIIQSKS